MHLLGATALLADMREAELQVRKASELAELQMKMMALSAVVQRGLPPACPGTFDGVALDGVSLIERGAPGHWLLGTKHTVMMS